MEAGLEIFGREFSGRTESSGTVRRPLPVKPPGIIMDSELLYQDTIVLPINGYYDLLWFVAAKLTFCVNNNSFPFTE